MYILINKLYIDKTRIKVENNKALPDTLDGFKKLFINPRDGTMVNNDLFKNMLFSNSCLFFFKKPGIIFLLTLFLFNFNFH